MSPLPPEDFLSSQVESASPGSKVYLYRTLRLLASTNTSGQFLGQPAYQGAKQLAVRLALHSPDGLAAFFKDLGLGDLRHEISRERLKLTVAGESSAAGDTIDDGSCDFERGLIDGALEFITGMPVTTGEVSCRKHGAAECTFEARLQADPGPPCYLPAADAGVFPAPSVNFMTPGNQLSMRSWYLDLAGRELARAKRHNRLLALLYIDLDDLGEINQTYGRKAGDQVIGAVAAALGKSCRCEDFIWHHGEDEFAVLLAETDPEGAKTVAGRLAVQILSAAEFVDVSAKVSASIGMALFPKHSETIHGLLNRAKSALYMAKASGKGMVHEAESPVDIARPNGDGTAGGATLSQGGEDSQHLSGNANRRAGEEQSQAGVDLSRVNGAGLQHVQSEGAQRQASDEPRGYAAGKTRGNRRKQGGGKAAAGSAAQRKAGNGPPATVLLASVSPVLIAGMKQVISSESTAGEEAMTMTSEITDSQKLTNTVLDVRPDLIFTDMHMATAADFTFPKLLNEENLPCKLVVFANDVNSDVLKLVTDYSIDGVILQQTPTAEALEMLKSIYLGKQLLPEQVRAAMLQLEDSRRLLGDLSERELEVLRLVAEGKSNSQISEDLYITVNTVRFHLANVYQKLGVGNRTEAAKYYLRQDLASNGQTKLL